MSTHHTYLTAALLLRLALGALLLAHAFLGLVALGVPAFAAALAAQGMPPQALPLTLMELAGGFLVVVGFRRRMVAS